MIPEDGAKTRMGRDRLGQAAENDPVLKPTGTETREPQEDTRDRSIINAEAFPRVEIHESLLCVFGSEHVMARHHSKNEIAKKRAGNDEADVSDGRDELRSRNSCDFVDEFTEPVAIERLAEFPRESGGGHGRLLSRESEAECLHREEADTVVSPK